MWVQMGLYGCVRVQGHGVTQKQDKHKQKWVGRAMVSMHVWPGNFPEKTHACAHRHEGVMSDSRGWGWVRKGAGGCIST